MRRVSQILANCCCVGTTYTTSPDQIEAMELEGYSRPTYNKLVHSATMCFTVVGVIHKLTVDVDNTCTPTTCCGEIFQVQHVEIARATLITPTYWTTSG